jgi:glycosyltransferase involved in cell wall biosynthesis
MKNLLVDINSVVPYFITGRTTGIGRTTLELIKALSEITPDLPFELTLFSQNMKGIGSTNFKSLFHARHLYLPNRKSVNRILSSFPFKENLFPYDLMHIPHNFEYLYKPEKAIVTLHDALFMRRSEKVFDHLGMRKRVPPLMRKCKGIITCSEASKKDIVETMSIDPDKIDVIYWGINHEVFHPIEDKEQVRKDIASLFGIINPFFLSVSCNAERKNTHILVESYLRILGQEPVNDLVLVWKNPPAHLLRMIEKADIHRKIHILSLVQDYDLASLYNGATALIYPSSYEGFGLPVVEAMACGTTVVTCRNSSLPEVGSGAALYMDEPSTENILAFLEGFENLEFDLAQLTSMSIKQASKFNWSTTALKYVDVYSKYLNI